MNTNTTLKIYRGDDVKINVTVNNSDGTAVDITGYTFWFTAKKQETDSDDDVVIQKTVTSHIQPTDGETSFDLSNSDTDVDIDSYYYDIQMKDTDDNIKTLLKGRLNVQQDITQATS